MKVAPFVPTAEQRGAIEVFKARYNKKLCKSRGFRDWVEALQVAWHQGWDYEMDGGSHLREIRNSAGGWEWLLTQRAR